MLFKLVELVVNDEDATRTEALVRVLLAGGDVVDASVEEVVARVLKASAACLTSPTIALNSVRAFLRVSVSCVNGDVPFWVLPSECSAVASLAPPPTYIGASTEIQTPNIITKKHTVSMTALVCLTCSGLRLSSSR